MKNTREMKKIRQERIMMYKEAIINFNRNETDMLFEEFHKVNELNICYHNSVIMAATDAMYDKVIELCDVLMHNDVFHKMYAHVLDYVIYFEASRYTKKLKRLTKMKKHASYAGVYDETRYYIDELDRTVTSLMYL